MLFGGLNYCVLVPVRFSQDRPNIDNIAILYLLVCQMEDLRAIFFNFFFSFVFNEAKLHINNCQSCVNDVIVFFCHQY